MDEKDGELLNLLQGKFPMESAPFRVLGEQLGMSEGEVIQRIGTLKRNGYIRRIGGIFDSGRLGYYSPLCALSIPEERISEVAAIINGYNGVTHNYIRNHSLNMWFTLAAPSKETARKTLKEIEEKAQTGQILSFPSEKTYKIRTNFDMKE